VSKKSSLGRGLDALLTRPAGESAQPAAGPQTLRVEQIVQAAYQPRQHFDPEALAELAQSVRDKGVLQPLLVRPKDGRYEIVAGERRWRAAQLAGLSEVPVVVRDLADREALEIAIVENLQREDLGPIEEARAYQALADQGLGHEGVAQAVGKSRSAVSNALRLLTLPEAALRALEDGQITAGHARTILAQPESDRLWALDQIRSRGLTVREAEALRRPGAPTPNEKAPAARPWRQIELELSRQVGTRVRINGTGERGRIELSFGSQEELDRLLGLLHLSEED